MNRKLLSETVRIGLFVLGAVGLAETVGFFFLQEWTQAIIPWELNRLAGIFLSSICAASSFPMIWIAFSKQYAALTGGAINFAVLFAGFAAFSFQVYAVNPRQPVLVFGLICAAGLLATLGLIFFGLSHTFDNARPVPGLVRISFLVFAANLVIAGVMLALKRPNVFPWELTSQQSVLYGWIFLGAGSYFLYGFLRPAWGNAHGQFFGFLAYDLILIGPFVALFFGSEPFLIPNLVYYIFMLTYSGALAVYYLFVNSETRISFQPSSE